MKRGIIVWAMVLTVLLMVGCGARSGGEGAADSGLSGIVATDGSSSMERMAGALGEAFTLKNPRVTFTYNPTGSGSGIAAVSQGRCHIGLSSRELTEAERASGLTAATVALDAIAVIVHPENPVTELTVEQIGKIYTGEISNWQEVGGKDAPIVVIGREAGSGTREGFEAVTRTADACRYRQELTSTGDVMTAVSQNPDAVGYASLASVGEKVRVISVGGVYPSEETVRNGSYGLSRPFILVTRTDAELPETAQAFLDYVLSPEAAEIISRAGAVPLSQAVTK